MEKNVKEMACRSNAENNQTDGSGSPSTACSAGWKNIDTAPRDGSRFVAMKYGAHPTTAYWALGMKEPRFVFDGWSHDPDALTHWISLPNAKFNGAAGGAPLNLKDGSASPSDPC